jgi:hypothetical protein
MSASEPRLSLDLIAPFLPEVLRWEVLSYLETPLATLVKELSFGTTMMYKTVQYKICEPDVQRLGHSFNRTIKCAKGAHFWRLPESNEPKGVIEWHELRLGCCDLEGECKLPDWAKDEYKSNH